MEFARPVLDSMRNALFHEFEIYSSYAPIEFRTNIILQSRMPRPAEILGRELSI